MNIAKNMEIIFVVAVITLCALSYQPNEVSNNAAATAQTASQNVAQKNA